MNRAAVTAAAIVASAVGSASYYLYVADADQSMSRAVSAGAESIMPVGYKPYGDRQGGVRDAWGNLWWISERLVDGPY